MNDRIKQVRQSVGLTQMQFAERLGLSRNFIAMVETGGRVPSDRTISDICREFNINESWLRTGDGDMMRKLTRDQEIAEYMGRLMGNPEDDIRKQFILNVSKLDADEMRLLAEIAEKMAGGK
jgi:transcriptional regulator with XRE-family HTH domain|nr:MAG TPA: Helix-turn-helix XRE-family like protein [Caudoviricetes sp.]